MMAVGHTMSGWCVGLVTSATAGTSTVVSVATGSGWAVGTAVAVSAVVATLTIAGALAGSATLPDLDHHGSTVTTAFGPVSWIAHRAVVLTHNMVARLTWDPGESMPGAHRGITHWWPTPLAVGALVGVACWFSYWVALAVLSVLFMLAALGITVPEYRPNERHANGVRRAYLMASFVPTIAVLRVMRRRLRRAGKLAVLLGCTTLAWLALRYAPGVGQWLGVIVALGMYVHIAGDAPTRSRVPGWTLRGEFRWPRRLAFRAGGTFEILCCWVPLSLVGIAALPWVWPFLWAAIA